MRKINYHNKNFRKYLGWTTLGLLFLLAVLKFLLGGCRLWLCAAFVAVVVSYMIFSDLSAEDKSGENSANR